MKKKAAARRPVHAAPHLKVAAKKPSMGLAVAALLINIFILPGVGSIIGGKVKDGLLQFFVLFVGGFVLGVRGIMLMLASPLMGMVIALAGGVMFLVGWVWAILTGIFLVRDSAT